VVVVVVAGSAIVVEGALDETVGGTVVGTVVGSTARTS